MNHLSAPSFPFWFFQIYFFHPNLFFVIFVAVATLPLALLSWNNPMIFLRFENENLTFSFSRFLCVRQEERGSWEEREDLQRKGADHRYRQRGTRRTGKMDRVERETTETLHLTRTSWCGLMINRTIIIFRCARGRSARRPKRTENSLIISRPSCSNNSLSSRRKRYRF